MKRAERHVVKPRLCFSGSALLRDATVNNDSELVSELIDSKERLGITNSDFNESLLKASKHGCTECVKLILTTVNTIEVDYQDEDLWTPLHMATASNHEEIVQLLIMAKADPTLLDVDGNFALDYAVNPRIKDLLLRYMADCGVYSTDLPSIKSRLPNAMKVAVANGLKRNKDMNAHNKNGVSPLHTAAANGYTDVVRMLIHSGAQLDPRDNEGYTPLSVSVKYHQFGVAKQLIEYGADVTVLDPEDLALIDAAAVIANGRPSMTHLMKNKLSSISHEDQMKEYQYLKQSGYAVDHNDRQVQLQAIKLASLYNTKSPDIIYEEVESVTAATHLPRNPSPVISEQYDTFANVKQEMNHDDDDTYDDAVSIRQSMGLTTGTNINSVDEGLYDDAVSVRQSMGLLVHADVPEEGLYDDTISVRRSMGLTTETTSDPTAMVVDEGLYDDAVSVRQSMGLMNGIGREGYNSGVPGSSSEVDVDLSFEGLLYNDEVSPQPSVNQASTEDVYDDAISLQQQMKKHSLSDRTPSSSPDNQGEEGYDPQPYLKAKPTAPDVYIPTASTYSPERRRKMTTRRGRLPKTKKQPVPSTNSPQPLTGDEGKPAIVPPHSPQRSPILKDKKSLRQKATVLSDKVPVAWQYKMQATKPQQQQQPGEVSPSTSPGTTPTHRPQQPSPTGHDRNHLQLSAPMFHNNLINRNSPQPSPTETSDLSRPSYSPVFNRHSPLPPIPAMSTSSTPPNSANSHVSRSVSPTYMMIPEQPPNNIYESFSSSSGEYSNPRESPGARRGRPTVNGSESGIKKMQLSNRKSVPAVLSSPLPPPVPPSSRRRISNGAGHLPRPPPRPARLSSPFDI